MTEKTPSENRALARRTPPPATEFDRVFDALWNRAHAGLGFVPFESGAFAPWTELGASLQFAPTDVVDTGAAYQITAEVPGIPKDQIDIRVKGNLVEISGEEKSEKKESARDFLYRERRTASFRRSFELPEPVVVEQAKAQVVNGVLELELPKQKPTPAPAETKIKVE